MHKLNVTLGKFGWRPSVVFFGVRALKPCFFLLKGIFSLDCCDSVRKTGWSVSIFMRNSWDSSFGIPILNLHWLNLINLSSEFAYRLLTTLC